MRKIREVLRLYGAFADQLPLALGQRGEDAEHEAAGRGRGVDLRALAGEHPQAHAAVLTRWARLRPRRSSFQTTSTSPFRRTRRQLSSPGRSSADAGGEVVVEVGASSMPAARRASCCRSSDWEPSVFETRA